MRVRITVLFALFIAGWLWLGARAQTDAPIVSGAHRFEKITDGIYYATASGTMQVGANSPVIVTNTEAIIIDSETSPAAGRALVQDIKAFTDKPVRYVIDSHFHYDHLFGNQIFGPDVRIIGHDHTRERLKVNTMEQYTFLTSVTPLPARELRTILVETPPGCTTDSRTGLAAICSSCRRLSEKPRTANFAAA